MQNKPKANLYIKTTVGAFLLESSPQGLTRCEVLEDAPSPIEQTNPSNTDTLLHQAADELQAYLEGSLKAFSVPLDLSDLSSFQQKVFAEVRQIPWGEVLTYAQVAAQIGQPEAARAVGTALAHNPLMLFIPCHRIIGSDGKLHGFSAPHGVALKAWLLDHEGVKVSDNNLCAPFSEEI